MVLIFNNIVYLHFKWYKNEGKSHRLKQTH